MHHHIDLTLNKNQRGAVSLITVMFITILLTVLTTSFIRMSITEQREAIDDDLTTRAFYAAEAGIQDAMRAIRDELNPATYNFDNCTAAHPLSANISSELDAEYTCQIIDMTPPDYRAHLDKNDSTFFKLKTATNDINDFTVSWHIYGNDSDTDGTDYKLRGATSDLLDEATWNAEDGSHKHPAMIRLQLVAVKAGADIIRDEITNEISFFNPAQGIGEVHRGAIFDRQVTDADCIKSVSDGGAIDYGQYACSMTVEGLDDAGMDYYLRIKSIYTDTHIKVIADDGSKGLIDAQAVVDVTGRVGDVYRRVEQRVNLDNDLLWPEFALYSAQEICKDFSISDPGSISFADINSGVNGSCAN